MNRSKTSRTLILRELYNWEHMLFESRENNAIERSLEIRAGI